VKATLIGGNDCIETLSIVDSAGQHNLNTLGRLAHYLTARRVTPLPGRVADRQAIGEARRDLARHKTLPGGLAYTDTIANVAAEQKLGNLPGPLRAPTSKRLRHSVTRTENQQTKA
jgi:hypothetical protein